MSKDFVEYMRRVGVHIDETVRQWPIRWLHERMVVNAGWEIIMEFLEKLKAGQELEPLVVCRKCLAVADGSHRLRAYLMAGYRFVPVQFADCHDQHDGFWCQIGQAPGMGYPQAWAQMPSVSTVYHRADLNYPLFAEVYNELGESVRGHCTPTRLWERARAAIFGVDWPPKKHVLDVGTRESGLPSYLAARGATVIAFDKNVGDIKTGEGITIVQGDARILPFPDDTFDAVTCVSCIHLIPKTGDTEAVREMVRVLKPARRVAITIPFWTEYREYPSRETKRRVYTKQAIYERLVEPVADMADICGPVDFDRTDWSYWPYKQECKAITDTGMNLQVAVLVLTKRYQLLWLRK